MFTYQLQLAGFLNPLHSTCLSGKAQKIPGSCHRVPNSWQWREHYFRLRRVCWHKGMWVLDWLETSLLKSASMRLLSNKAVILLTVASLYLYELAFSALSKIDKMLVTSLYRARPQLIFLIWPKINNHGYCRCTRHLLQFVVQGKALLSLICIFMGIRGKQGTKTGLFSKYNL